MFGQPYPLLVPVNLQPGRFVQGPNAELADQVGFFEGVAANAENQAQQPFLTRHGVQEPALAFLGSGNLNYGAVVPVGATERTKGMNLLVKPVEDLTFPADR